MFIAENVLNTCFSAFLSQFLLQHVCTLGGLWGIPLAEVGTESDDLLQNRDVKHIGTIKHDFTHRKLFVDVYTTNPRTGEMVTNPDNAPLSSLDRKILSLVDAV